DAESRTQRERVPRPALAEHAHLAGVRLVQALADLDGRGLAGPVRAEQAEALAGTHLEVEAGDGLHGAVALDEATADEGGLRLAHGTPPIIDESRAVASSGGARAAEPLAPARRGGARLGRRGG